MLVQGRIESAIDIQVGRSVAGSMFPIIANVRPWNESEALAFFAFVYLPLPPQSLVFVVFVHVPV